MSPPIVDPEPATALRGRVRVLVVDDSVDHRALITRRLTAEGMRVDTADSAEAALERVAGVDIVLLDYRLPGVDGLELLRQICALPQGPAVIMVTGAGSTELAVEAMRAGAINYVAKDHGYLDALPEVVERAWSHHDLAARAAELQRLALLMTSATDRRRLFDEIVGGATRLLRAESCALLLAHEGRLEPVTGVGPERDELSELVIIDLVDHGTASTPRIVDDHLLVPLPSADGDPVGMLAVRGREQEPTPEDLELSRVFASFAGIALRNLRQFELERMLVTELQQTLDVRHDFVASVSHELRTPLTSIAGFTQTLRAHWDLLADPQRADLLDRIERNADDLRALVDELLDLAELERGRLDRLDLREVEVQDQVVQVLGQLEHVLADRDVRVDVGRLRVVADATLLRRALANLLSNAAKYSELGTPIEVLARRDGDDVRIEVVDHGIGLPEWEASRVFEPFFRTRSSVANAVRGSGIGLTLVREYVHTMGGAVFVESTPGEGSAFGFFLPATRQVG